MINYLNSIFPSFVQNHITYKLHNDKSHGILIDEISDNIKLVIAPDSSSNEEDLHKKLYDNGVDVLVIDHHEAQYVSKYACVINNQLCEYQNKSLCGGGMVYKFCCCLDDFLNIKQADNFLDLVALSLIGDMMDLRENETRHLITKGLNNIRNPFFKALASKQKYSIDKGGGLNPFTIGWYISPMINAVVRSGTVDEKHLLFESMIEFLSYEQILSNKRGAKPGQTETRVEQAIRLCQNVKTRQDNIKMSNTEIIENIINENDLLNKHKILAIKLDKSNSIDVNLTGLIANQLASKYQRPVLLLNYRINENNEISWDGSGRNCAFSKIENLKDFLTSTNLMKLAEGHQSAFGVGVYDKDFNNFINTTDELLKDIKFEKQYIVDYIFNQQNIDEQVILNLGKYSHIWGQNIAEPYIALENIKLNPEHIQLIGSRKKTIKITLQNNINMITFKGSEEIYEQLLQDCQNKTFTFICKCKINEWNGIISPQLEIEDYEPSKTYFF